MNSCKLILLAVCIAGVLVGCGGKKKPEKQSGEQMGFYCIETEEEFYLNPEEVLKCKSSDGTYDFTRIPKLKGDKKWVMMTFCPNCHRFFVPEYLRSKFEDTPALIDTNTDLICPHCGMDVVQWYRDRRKKQTQPVNENNSD